MLNINGKKMTIVSELDWSTYDQMWTLNTIDDDGNHYRLYYHDLGADVELDEYDYEDPSCVEDVNNEYQEEKKMFTEKEISKQKKVKKIVSILEHNRNCSMGKLIDRIAIRGYLLNEEEEMVVDCINWLLANALVESYDKLMIDDEDLVSDVKALVN